MTLARSRTPLAALLAALIGGAGGYLAAPAQPAPEIVSLTACAAPIPDAGTTRLIAHARLALDGHALAPVERTATLQGRLACLGGARAWVASLPGGRDAAPAVCLGEGPNGARAAGPAPGQLRPLSPGASVHACLLPIADWARRAVLQPPPGPSPRP